MSPADKDTTMNLRIDRRRVLGWLAAAPVAEALLPLSIPGFASAAVPTDVITVLYKPDTLNAPTRLDPAAQAATLALEDEFGKRGFRVLQPSPETYAALDKGPAVAVSFAPDAGFSLLFSAYKSQRPLPGTEMSTTEVILRYRVVVGHSVVTAEEARGMMAAKATSPEEREFAVRRSADLAAQQAVAQMADKVARRLKAISATDLERLASIAPPPLPDVVQVALPPPPPPPPAPPAPAPQAAPAPSPAQAAATPAPPPTAATAQAGQGAAPSSGGNGPIPNTGRRYALMVTMSDYSVVRQRNIQIKDLKGVAVDRQHLKAALSKLGYQVTSLEDGGATGANVRQALTSYVKAVGPDDLLMIIFSGHGGEANMAPSGFGLPILADYSPQAQGLLDFWQLQSYVANIPNGRTVLAVDTCFSGGVANNLRAVVSPSGVSAQAGRASPDPARMARSQLQSNSGRALAVLTAASPNQVSLEDARGGLFTTAFVAAMEAGHDKKTLEDMFNQDIVARVRRDSTAMCSSGPDGCYQGQREQTPLFAYSGQGNRITV